MSDLAQRLEVLQRELPGILREQVVRLPFILHIFIEQHFNEGRKTGAFNTSDKLYVGQGNLTRSFIPNQPGNINDVQTTARTVAIVTGSEVIYAPIQEYGGFIKSRGKMHKYFWARFYETGNDDFKAMALSVLKQGGVTIKPRPFFNPAVAAFQRKGLPQLAQDITTQIARVLSGG